MKLVSIVIPTYGGGEYLDKTIESIISQDYENIEIIVVDDNGKGTENQKKTYEGLIAGSVMSFIVSALILILFPIDNMDLSYIYIISFINSFFFALIDIFIKNISDNILNVFIPGLFTWIMII